MEYKKDYFGYVYIWYDRYRKKFCVGCHYGDVNDRYKSSTGHFKAAYRKRPQDFRMRVLQYLTTADRRLLFELEYRWLQMIKDKELNTKYYNRKKTMGFNISKSHGPTTREKMSKIHKGKIPWNKGLKMPEEFCEKVSQKTKGRKAWNKGLPNTTAAQNGKRGAKKQSEYVTGRKRKYRNDGSWFWIYPNKKG